MVYNLYSGSIVWQQPTSDIRSISHYPLPHRFILFFIQIFFFVCVEDREKPNYIPTYNFIIIATPNTIKMDKRRRRSQLTIQQKQTKKSDSLPR